MEKFKRYFQKIQANSSSGQATKKLQNWVWAEQMSFLESSTTPNQTESSIILDNESSQHEETNEESANQPTPSTSCDATTVP